MQAQLVLNVTLEEKLSDLEKPLDGISVFPALEWNMAHMLQLEIDNPQSLNSWPHFHTLIDQGVNQNIRT